MLIAGNPLSLKSHNMTGNGVCDGAKILEDWAISSQAHINAVMMCEGSTTIESRKVSRVGPSGPKSMAQTKKQEVQMRLASKTDTERSNTFSDGLRCHEWVGSLAKNGYGFIHYKGRTAYAHRVKWETVNGEIPKGMLILHKCDNRKCVNVAHLFVGSFNENMGDMTAKLRQAHGAKNGHAKLTTPEVLAIRELTGTHKEIAKQFSVSQALVSMIKSKRIWKYV